MGQVPDSGPGPQPFISSGLVFPEGPRSHDGRLWLSDIHAHRVLAFDLDGSAELVADLPDRPSGLGFLPDGTALAACMRRQVLVRLPATSLDEVYADLSGLGGTWTNDMVVDGEGRAYVGMMTGRGPGRDQVVLVPSGGEPVVAAEGLTTPNGLAVTPDGGTFYVAQTQGHRIEAFSIAPDGTLRDRRLVAEFPEAVPDGICLDAEGAIWMASPLTGEFLRLDAEGRTLDRIEYSDGSWPVACALGGENGCTLFLVIARSSLENQSACADFESDLGSTASGRVESLRVEAPGAGWP